RLVVHEPRPARADEVAAAVFFSRFDLIADWQRRGSPLVHDVASVANNFAPARRHVGAAGASRAHAHLAGALDHIFAAAAVGGVEGLHYLIGGQRQFCIKDRQKKCAY
ncbi:hypothetical protein B1218_34925, partial [Pseudomonas ogarae]